MRRVAAVMVKDESQTVIPNYLNTLHIALPGGARRELCTRISFLSALARPPVFRATSCSHELTGPARTDS
jgi:hypothetical protein